jgi:hypothetical protein
MCVWDPIVSSGVGKHMVFATVDPALRALIEAIEAWPTAVSQAERRATASSRKAKPFRQNAVGAARGDVNTHSPSLRGPGVYAPLGSLQEPSLSSSLRAPEKQRLSSMASSVPQRSDSWKHSALGPNLGPGAYTTPTLDAMEIRDEHQRSMVFRSTVARLGNFGEPSLPEGMYAHTQSPLKPRAKVHGVSPFISLTYKNADVDEYLRSVERMQRLPAPRREAQHWQGAPKWEGPFAALPPSAVALPTDMEEHRSRLAAARAAMRDDAHGPPRA